MPSTTEGIDRPGRIARNEIPGVRGYYAIGERFNVPNFTEATIWDGPVGLYTFTDSVTERIDVISSDSTLDIGIPVQIEGLDENWQSVTQIAILNGQNKVTLSPELIRLNRATALQDLNGNVYIYEDGAITAGIPNNLATVRGYIDPVNNITQQSVFSVPVGYIAQFKGMILGVVPSVQCCISIKAYVKFFNGATIKAFENPLVFGGTTQFDIRPSTVVPYPEKSDIFINLATKAQSGGAVVFHDWELIR